MREGLQTSLQLEGHPLLVVIGSLRCVLSELLKQSPLYFM